MKRSIALILAIVMMMALVACGGDPGTSSVPGNASSSGATSTPSTTDIKDVNKEQEATVDTTKTYKKELAVTYTDNITQFDPMLKTGNGPDMAYKMVYNQLISYNYDTKELEPELAESWTVEAADSYVFNLRKGIKFSNGEELTADDIVFTFVDRPKAVEGTTGSAIWNEIAEIEVLNDYSVRFKLTKADADFLYRIWLAYFAVVNREACQKDAENGHMVGTGGWIVDSWAPGDHVTFVRHDGSWVWEESGMNPTEKVVFRYMTEGTARAIALQNKELAAVNSIGSADLPALEADKNVHVYTFPTETLSYLCFNMQNGALAKNEKLRKAVAYALNYDELNDYLLDGLGTHTQTMWGSNQYGLVADYDEEYEYNPEKAKQLMTEAGYPNGFEFGFTTSQDGLATLIQAQLQLCNIKVNVVIADAAGISAAVKDGSYDMLYYTISLRSDGGRFAFIPDIKHSTNRAHYDNPEMLAKFTAAQGESDDDKRKELYKEIQVELHDQIPYLPLFYQVRSVGWYEGVTGIKWEYDSKPDFTHIMWEE